MAKKAEAVAEKGEHGMFRSHDLPWCEAKVKVYKALKMLRCLSPETAKPAAEIAEKAGVTPSQVRHYCYHGAAKKDHQDNPQKPKTGIAEHEGAGRVYYLTKEGAALDPAGELKKKEAAKAEK